MTLSLLQKQSIDFKTFFNIFTRFKSKALIRLNTVCVQYYMHITTSIELFELFITFILAAFQYKSKTQRKKTKYKEKNTFLNKQLISADNNYLKTFFYCKSILSFNHFILSQFLNIIINSIKTYHFNKEESKIRMNKKSFNRRLKSRSRYSSATNLKSFDLFVIFLFNDTNQLITENKNEKSKQIKVLDTIKLYSKTISFFQNVLLTKDRYNIKLDFENFIFLYYYDRQFVKKDLQYFVFINKKSS